MDCKMGRRGGGEREKQLKEDIKGGTDVATNSVKGNRLVATCFCDIMIHLGRCVQS